jgi:plastocyanin
MMVRMQRSQRCGQWSMAIPCMLAVLWSSPVSAQSVLDRPPNLGGTWVADAGVLQFNFLHRFNASDAPARKVSNVPTFLMAFGLPAHTMLGVRYATSSQVVAALPNEWEFFGRINPLAESRGSILDVSLHAGYNQGAESFDAELSAARSVSRLRLLGSGRFMSNAFDAGEERFALAGGAILTLTPNIALAGDVATLLDADSSEEVAWGAGLQLRIPYTPHTLSLQVTNTNSGTIEGTSVGVDETRYGFEFTIPFTLSRYFGRRAQAGTEPAVQATGDTVRIVMQNLAYANTRVEISRGTTVIWENRDAVPHTSTADDGRWDSGLIEGGRSWSRTFGETGTFNYHCTPHPFMKATIIVR